MPLREQAVYPTSNDLHVTDVDINQAFQRCMEVAQRQNVSRQDHKKTNRVVKGKEKVHEKIDVIKTSKWILGQS